MMDSFDSHPPHILVCNDELPTLFNSKTPQTIPATSPCLKMVKTGGSIDIERGEESQGDLGERSMGERLQEKV
jgi:hypothetical protein